MGRLLGRLSQRISGHVMAVKTSARGRWLSVPLQMLRIAACRLFYRIGSHQYCLYRLDRKPVRTWRTYIYDARAQQRSINPGRILVDDKIAFHRECLKHGLRTVAILGLFAEKSTPGSDDDPPLIRDPAHLQRLLEANPDGLFVKRRDGSYGEGAFAILPHSGNWRFPGGIGTAHDAFEYCVSCAKAATLLVQPRLITGDALPGVIAPDAFATIRAVTYMHDQRSTLIKGQAAIWRHRSTR
jgi:hypothetical protein